jgi:hypothetical protein
MAVVLSLAVRSVTMMGVIPTHLAGSLAMAAAE